MRPRRLSPAELGLCASLLLLVWLALRSLHRDALLQTTAAFLSQEERRCLYRQGLDATGRLAANATYSQFFCSPRLYPGGLCSVHSLVLEPERRTLVARVSEELVAEVNEELAALPWPLRGTDEGWPRCERYFDEAFLFAVGGARAEEPYYALHVDTFLPLFSLLALRKHLGPPAGLGYSVAFLPAVEDYALQSVSWDTDLFNEDLKFSILPQMLEAFAGSMAVVPLADEWIEGQPVTCINHAHFGVGVVNHSDPALLQSFSEFMRGRLNLPYPFPTPSEPFVSLIKRSLSRRVLNEDQLVKAVSKLVPIEVVQLASLSYREQVSLMQRVTVLVGFHGEELMNAIYLPPGAVAIQLIPYGTHSLDTKGIADILLCRGPYMEWRNSHEGNSRPSDVGGADDGMADTIVHVEEFVELMKQALSLGVNRRLVQLGGG